MKKIKLVCTLMLTVTLIGGSISANAENSSIKVATKTPGTITMGTITPGTTTPGTSTPGTSTPGTTTPGTSTPGTSTPGTSTPGTDYITYSESGFIYKLYNDGTALIVGLDDDNQSDSVYILQNIKYQGKEYKVLEIESYRMDSFDFTKKIIVDDDNPYYSTINGALFTKDKKELLKVPTSEFEEYTVPDGVIEIGNCAFSGEKLKKINIPSSVKYMNKFSFSGCNNLNEVNIDSKNSIYSAEQNVIYQVDDHGILTAMMSFGNPKSIKIKQGTKYIEYCMFEGNKTLEEIDIPDTVDTIGDMAFGCCDNLKRIVLGNKDVKVYGNSFLRHNSDLIIECNGLKVPINDFKFNTLEGSDIIACTATQPYPQSALDTNDNKSNNSNSTLENSSSKCGDVRASMPLLLSFIMGISGIAYSKKTKNRF